MGYTHGKQWSDDMIRAAILGVQNTLCINRMPTRSECETVTGSHSLSNAITRHGGWYRWAEIMGLPIKESETTTGKAVEALIAEKLKVLGHEVQRMSQNHPYDLLLDGCVKIDVKASHICKGRTGDYYSFIVTNLEWCTSSYNKRYGNGRTARSEGMKKVWQYRRADDAKAD